MFSLLLRFLIRQPWRPALLGLGLLLLSSVALLTGAASESTVVTAEEALSRYWRTTYDILVRPAGARSSIEEKYGLVEANHLSALAGGISLEHYHAIRSIPDVEVAAPVAMLTYIEEELVERPLQAPLVSGGVYVLEGDLTVDQGAFTRQYPHRYYSYNNYNGPPSSPAPGIIVNDSANERAVVPIPPLYFLLAAIDPLQEAKLVGLDQTLLEGQYLTGSERISLSQDTDPFGKSSTRVDGVPVLINITPYVRFTIHTRVARVLLPAEAAELATIKARGGAAYLDTLPTETIAEQTIDSQTAYPRLIKRLWQPGQLGSLQISHVLDLSRKPIGRKYREITPPFQYDGLVLELEEPAADEGSLPNFSKLFSLRAIGIFSLARIPQPADVNRVPLETYFPPVATLRYDESGQPVEPRALYPTINPRGYLLSPPLMLTTLEAARLLAEDNFISAIRVRVAGIEALTPEAQRKIEAVASEIVRRTGLTVDIMVGSSPRRVLVRVPEVGYVEEGWIQKEVTLAYRRRIQAGHWLIGSTLLSVGTLYVLDLAWAEVMARRRLLALQKALGWRSWTVFALMVGQTLLVGAVAAGMGTLVAWQAARWLSWQIPSPLLAGTPVLMIGLCLVGGLYPAWRASQMPPIIEIQRGGVWYKRVWVRSAGGLVSYVWRSLLRRWSRTVLSGVAAALSATLLVLLLAVTLERQGYLSGTLLGEYILVRVEPHHFAITGMGFGLAALATFNSLLSSALERRLEIGILKALGWRTGTVARLYLTEGTLIGMTGGLAGAVLGLGLFTGLYHIVTLNTLGIGLVGVGVPTLVGMLAALYPAHTAARVPPAEALRYE